eukprot:1159902-Pelagomonas_calceolata.AAC.7
MMKCLTAAVARITQCTPQKCISSTSAHSALQIWRTGRTHLVRVAEVGALGHAACPWPRARDLHLRPHLHPQNYTHTPHHCASSRGWALGYEARPWLRACGFHSILSYRMMKPTYSTHLAYVRVAGVGPGTCCLPLA